MLTESGCHLDEQLNFQRPYLLTVEGESSEQECNNVVPCLVKFHIHWIGLFAYITSSIHQSTQSSMCDFAVSAVQRVLKECSSKCSLMHKK